MSRPAGYRHTEETRLKMSLKRSSPETKERMSAARKKFWTPERRAAVSDFMKGSTLPIETRINMSIAQIGKKRAPTIAKGSVGPCDICSGNQVVGASLAQDHDHMTNQLRGKLCNHCNLGLGNFKDNPKLLRIAADYLERWS